MSKLPIPRRSDDPRVPVQVLRASAVSRVARSLGVTFIAFLVTFQALVQPANSQTIARIFVSPDATDSDVLTIRKTIIGAGAKIEGYARGEVFVVSVDPRALPVLARVPRVSKVDLSPAPPPEPPRSPVLDAYRSAAAQAPANCLRPTTPEEAAFVASSLTPSLKIDPSPLGRRRALLAGTLGLPPSADNSLSPHFPPIGDQEGRSACVAFAAGYYWSTYTQAADENLDVSGVWLPRDPPCDILTDGQFDPIKFAACLPTIKDPPRPSRATEHIASPAFLYPLINGGSDLGASLEFTMVRLSVWGAGSWAMKPFDPWLFESVVYAWPTEEQWVEALSRRTSASFLLSLNEQADFDTLKQLLANGDLAVAAFQASEALNVWGGDQTCQLRPNACPGIDNDVLYANQGPMRGGHAITIVGYDDGKQYLDQNGQLKSGAFLIANSAGPTWGVSNSAGGSAAGFFWVAYEFASAHFYDVIYNADRARYRPRLYAATQLTAAQRSTLLLVGGVGIPALTKYSISNVFPLWDLDHPIESDKRFVIDLTDGLPTLDPTVSVPLLYAELAYGGYGGYGDSPAATIGNTDFYYDYAGDGQFMRLPSPDTTKTVTPDTPEGIVCTDVAQNGEVNGDGRVDGRDIKPIMSARGQSSQCVSDPRDMNRDGTITIFDVRTWAQTPR